MERVKIAIVGPGMIADEVYIPGILAMNNAELVAVCGQSEANNRAVCDKFGVPQNYTSWKQMIAEEPFDLLLNLTPIQDHYPINLAALQAGKHVLTEKSIAGTVREATELIETARQKGVKLGSQPATGLAAVVRKVAEMVAAGAIGKVAFARVVSSNGGPAYETVWPADPEWFYKKGAGPMHDMGVYGLHTITGILGPARRVTAMSGITDPERVVRGGPFAGKRITVEEDDVTLMLLDFGNATFASIDGSFCVRATKMPSQVSMELYGSDGTIVASVWEAEEPLSLWRDDIKTRTRGWTRVEVDTRPWSLSSAVDHMVECILENRQPVCSGEHARHVVEIIEKADAAARTGQTQTLDTVF